jgi:hypothetical protein
VVSAVCLKEGPMEFGLGLPFGDPGSLIDAARRPEAAGIATPALFERLVYDNPEPVAALVVRR